MNQLGDLLDRAREQCFVGRRDELSTFDDALTGRSARRVLIAYGPGGIGKTTLLHEMGRRARAAGRTVRVLDGREIEPSPAGFREALGADPPAGQVLLVDGYELLAAIDGWLRREFLPGRSADDLVVLAGRDAPGRAWRADPGWRRLVAVHRLDFLDDRDSAELLRRAGVDPRTRDRLAGLGRGHPLALALLADAAAAGPVPQRLADVPDLITTLLECLIQRAPSDAHSDGLATCAIAWLTTEDLLRDTVGERAAEVWAWLRRRPFLTCGRHGMVAHDLVRDVLDAEFERRSPQQYRRLHTIIHDHVVDGMRTAGGPDRQLLAQQLLHLHRRSPLTSMVGTLRAPGSAVLVPGRPDDHDTVVATIDRFQGRAAADAARDWLADQPQGLAVVRTEAGLSGFALQALLPTGTALPDTDPLARAAMAHVAAHGPLRPGELVNLAPFFAGVREHQRDAYAVLAGSLSSVIEWVSRPLAWSFVVVVDPDFWDPIFDYLAFGRAFETQAHGLRHVAYAQDWRRVTVDDWLRMMTEREHSGGAGPPPPEILRPPPIGRPEFTAALRAALAGLHRPDRLATSPLLRTKLAPEASPHRLRAALETGVRALAAQPKGGPLAAVLDRTYLRAAPTQEAAAEVLGLPFSTYRRHLAKALDELADLLWAVEIGRIRIPHERSNSR